MKQFSSLISIWSQVKSLLSFFLGLIVLHVGSWLVPQPGIKLMPLRCKYGVPTTGPPGKSQNPTFKTQVLSITARYSTGERIKFPLLSFPNSRKKYLLALGVLSDFGLSANRFAEQPGLPWKWGASYFLCFFCHWLEEEERKERKKKLSVMACIIFTVFQMLSFGCLWFRLPIQRLWISGATSGNWSTKARAGVLPITQELVWGGVTCFLPRGLSSSSLYHSKPSSAHRLPWPQSCW